MFRGSGGLFGGVSAPTPPGGSTGFVGLDIAHYVAWTATWISVVALIGLIGLSAVLGIVPRKFLAGTAAMAVFSGFLVSVLDWFGRHVLLASLILLGGVCVLACWPYIIAVLRQWKIQGAKRMISAGDMDRGLEILRKAHTKIARSNGKSETVIRDAIEDKLDTVRIHGMKLRLPKQETV